MADAAAGVTVPIIPWEEITLGPLIGKGGYGLVYRGAWKHMREEVAVKKIKGTIGVDAAQELKEEAGVIARLNSPYIVRLFGLCWEHQNYAMVMELMPNASLYECLHNGQPLPWNVRYSIAQDIAYGLRLLHTRRILHRDLKSLNVLLDGNLRARLADFGLAKVKSQSRTTSKDSGGSAGTIAWMAPELFDGEACSAASDIYSYGMISWELATREAPFSHVANEKIIPHLVSAKGKRPEIPPECTKSHPSFISLIQSCWSQEASSRPHIDRVVEILGEIIQSEGAAAAPSAVPVAPKYQDVSSSSLGVVTGAKASQAAVHTTKYSELRKQMAQLRFEKEQENARIEQERQRAEQIKSDEELARCLQDEAGMQHTPRTAGAAAAAEPAKVKRSKAEETIKPTDSQHYIEEQIIPWTDLEKGKEIGKGGFATVFEGNWKQEGSVAIKQNTGVEEKDWEQMLHEYNIMATINSFYIPRVFGVCKGEQGNAIIMELMTNGDLYRLLHSYKELSWITRYKIAKDVAQAIRIMHSKHVLHRDIKSLNVLLDDNLRAKLGGFCLAIKEKDVEREKGSACGTERWMAPELFDEPSRYSKASDIYAYGTTLWEIATRKIPYDKQFKDNEAIKTIVIGGERPPIPADCPPQFGELIKSCWTQDPRLRPNIGTIITSLEAIISTPVMEIASEDLDALLVLTAPSTPVAAASRSATPPPPPQPMLPQAQAVAARTKPIAAVDVDDTERKYPPVAPPRRQPAVAAAPLIAEFLHNVAYGEQDKAEAQLKQTPALAIATGDITDHANRTFRNITGFQYAVWALDWHMWRMIMQYLPSERAASQATQFSTGPWVRQHGEHAKQLLQNLIQAYDANQEMYKSTFTSKEKRHKHWLKNVGSAQRQLPIHVLQEYCHPDRPFYPCPTFKEDEFPRELAVDISKISIDFSLVRSNHSFARGRIASSGMGWMSDILPRERNAVFTLLKTRISQRRELVASLTSGVRAKPALR